MLALAPRLNQLVAEYKGRAAFVAVYIAEAHAKDEWPVGSAISCCDQPVELELQQRMDLAKKLQTTRSITRPLLVDTMQNEFLDAFVAWPLRFFVASGDAQPKLLWKATPKDCGYDIEELAAWLQHHL